MNEQRRAAKSNERQMQTPVWKYAPETKTSHEKQQRAFLFPISIHLLQLWTFGRWLTSKVIKNHKEQQRATTSNEKQQKATKSNKKQKRTSELEEPKRRHKKSKWNFAALPIKYSSKINSISCKNRTYFLLLKDQTIPRDVQIRKRFDASITVKYSYNFSEVFL